MLAYDSSYEGMKHAGLEAFCNSRGVSTFELIYGGVALLGGLASISIDGG